MYEDKAREIWKFSNELDIFVESYSDLENEKHEESTKNEGTFDICKPEEDINGTINI